jgi:uncharacterized membrane protein YphA (DoxX/SURF4 family)
MKSIFPLITFRIIFGAMMLLSALRFMALGWVEAHYIAPKLHFTYYGFSWVQAISPTFVYGLHIVMILAAIGVLLGCFYRISALLLFLTFTYTELIDLTYYLNHYYFVSIICFLLILVPANSYFSVDVLRNPHLQRLVVPAWTIWIFQFQLAIVYIYAGIAKINYTWLIEAMPLKIWLPANDKFPFIGWIFGLKFIPHLFAWFGMLYDCSIVFFLCWRKTRLFAYFAVVVFHILTGLLFQIGVFPLVMISSTLLFFSEEWHRNLLNYFQKNPKQLAIIPWITPNKIPFFTSLFLVFHLSFQIIFPFRYLLYRGNLLWTEQGYRFGWRVMLMEKAGTATFFVKDSRTQREGEVVNSEFLTPDQEKQMAMQPDMLLQFAHFLAKHYAKKGVFQPQVRVEAYVTLNGQPSKLLINPTVDLTKIEDSFAEKHWILP